MEASRELIPVYVQVNEEEDEQAEVHTGLCLTAWRPPACHIFRLNLPGELHILGITSLLTIKSQI